MLGTTQFSEILQLTDTVLVNLSKDPQSFPLPAFNQTCIQSLTFPRELGEFEVHVQYKQEYPVVLLGRSKNGILNFKNNDCLTPEGFELLNDICSRESVRIKELTSCNSPFFSACKFDKVLITIIRPGKGKTYRSDDIKIPFVINYAKIWSQYEDESYINEIFRYAI